MNFSYLWHPLYLFVWSVPLPAAVPVALKFAGRFAVKWAPYYAAKWGFYVAMREYGVPRTYRRLVRGDIRSLLSQPLLNGGRVMKTHFHAVRLA